MYVDPFIGGIIVGATSTLVCVIVAAIIYGKKGK